MKTAFEIYNEQNYQSWSVQRILDFTADWLTKGEISLFTIKKPTYSVTRFYVSTYQEIIHSSDVYALCKHFSVTCSPQKAVGGTVLYGKASLHNHITRKKSNNY